jgi:protoporphyrinogen oxidase
MAYERTAASFIWAYSDRMYKARRSGMKRELFGYVPGGYKRIIDGLEKHLLNAGVTIITNAPVQRIVNRKSTIDDRSSSSKNQQKGSSIDITFGTENNVMQQSFDRVIMTTPYRVIDNACDGLSDSERQKFASTEYLGVVCTSILFDKPLTGYYVTNIIDDWVPLTGIIEMGSILPPEKLGGNYLVYLPQYMLSDDSRFNESDDQIHERCLATLERMYPDKSIRQSVKSIQTARARFVMALPTLNFSESRPPVLLSQSGIYLLNSARIVKGTLNVNETLELLEEEFNGVIWPNHLTIQ